MSGLRPGDRVLYRDGDRFRLAKVELVGERHVTGFPFDPECRQWSRARRRIAADFVIGTLPPGEHSDRAAIKIERLTMVRDAQRRAANAWAESALRELIAP